MIRHLARLVFASLLATGCAAPPAAEAPRERAQQPLVLLASDAGAAKLFSGTGATHAEALARAGSGALVSRELHAAATLTVCVRRDEATGSNVAGVLRGADVALRGQALAYSAHYDAFDSLAFVGGPGDGAQ
jgi:hypothetical protein